MRHVKMLFGVLLALAVAALAVSAAAFAESGILPRPGTVSVTGLAGKFVSKNGLTVKGTSSEGTLVFSNDNSGTFDILFLGTTGPLGVKCIGLSDKETGSILSKGTFTIDKGTEAESPGSYAVLTPEEVHFTCGSILSVVRGRVVGKIEVNEEKGEGSTVFTQSGGVNTLTSAELPAGSKLIETGIILETSTGGGKFEQSGEETTDSGSLGVTKPVLMN